MKNTTKQILLNVGIVCAAGIALGPLGILSSPILAITGICTLAGTAIAGNMFFIKSAELPDIKVKTIEMGNDCTITEQVFNSLSTPDDFVKVLEQISRVDKYRAFTGNCISILSNWETFQKKKTTLDTLTVNNGSYDTVTADVESAIVGNMKALIKRVIIIQSENDMGMMEKHYSYIRELDSNVRNILQAYTKLLIEVSQLEDGQFDSSNSDVESLNNLINSINSYRVHNKA